MAYGGVFEVFRGDTLFGPPSFHEMSVSRNAVRMIGVEFPKGSGEKARYTQPFMAFSDKMIPLFLLGIF